MDILNCFCIPWCWKEIWCIYAFMEVYLEIYWRTTIARCRIIVVTVHVLILIDMYLKVRCQLFFVQWTFVMTYLFSPITVVYGIVLNLSINNILLGDDMWYGINFVWIWVFIDYKTSYHVCWKDIKSK